MMRVCQRLWRQLWELGILKRLIVSPAVYPRFLEIAELARSQTDGRTDRQNYDCQDRASTAASCDNNTKYIYTKNMYIAILRCQQLWR